MIRDQGKNLYVRIGLRNVVYIDSLTGLATIGISHRGSLLSVGGMFRWEVNCGSRVTTRHPTEVEEDHVHSDDTGPG